MKTKKTAVDYLISEILVHQKLYFDEEGDYINIPRDAYYNAFIDSHNLIEYVNKAKEMEKEQIEEAFNNSYWFIDGKDYYEKTFK